MAKTQPRPVDSEVDDATADAEALEDLNAGRTISHDKMKTWLRSWGRPDELPAPRIPGDDD
jgi:predicted transcriptional regulator